MKLEVSFYMLFTSRTSSGTKYVPSNVQVCLFSIVHCIINWHTVNYSVDSTVEFQRTSALHILLHLTVYCSGISFSVMWTCIQQKLRAFGSSVVIDLKNLKIQVSN